ncbi:hypothetical protein BSYN_23640 [Bacteroides sedimenti]|uniref:Uncharacterized protein n=1 Tax=Bacteroides sedimenti TaxID=2136147 RepID=A0ABM8IJ16_9BACE
MYSSVQNKSIFCTKELILLYRRNIVYRDVYENISKLFSLNLLVYLGPFNMNLFADVSFGGYM